MRTSFFLTILLYTIPLFSQECKTDKLTIDRLISDIEYLSDDKLEGREVGTRGERLALSFLKERFGQLDINTQVHTFDFNEKVKIKFLSNYPKLYPTKYSSNGTVKKSKIVDVNFGIEAKEFSYFDYNNIDVRGKVVLINTSSPDGIHPHSQYLKYHDLKLRAEIAKQKGAQAVIYYTDNNFAETPEKTFKKIQSVGIPVLFFDDKKEKLDLENIFFKVGLEESIIKGKNLIAYIDNKAKHSIIIGAHYDHLGWGAEGSLYRGDPKIHNGADDNASGTAALLELASRYKKSKFNQYNYIFIAFSGEEKGLLGSNAYTKSDLFNSSEINYMINMDMIGRLDAEKNLAIFGTGTSKRWKGLLKNNVCGGLKMKFTESGIGGSDHTSFYLEEIPVLHFFTGAHEDYHKPTDDAEKINYKGLALVISFIEKLINDLDDEKKLEFVKTKNENTKKTPKFKVTLGIVPDYLYSEEGVRVDGISDNRPAYNAGIQKGDVIIQLGKIKIIDMMSYMRGLSIYNKGDTVDVRVIRNSEELVLSLTF